MTHKTLLLILCALSVAKQVTTEIKQQSMQEVTLTDRMTYCVAPKT